MMTILTVNIDNKKTEKALKGILDALGLDYNVNPNAKHNERPLIQPEQHLYENLKGSFEQIKLHKEGKVKLQDAKTGLLEIEAELGE